MVIYLGIQQSPDVGRKSNILKERGVFFFHVSIQGVEIVLCGGVTCCNCQADAGGQLPHCLQQRSAGLPEAECLGLSAVSRQGSCISVTPCHVHLL